MPNSELMPIGGFAQRSGLTASALRFYADSGLLRPAEVDPLSGYRFYGTEQLERAVLLRRLREIGMPLAAVGFVLDADEREAVRLVDDHVNTVVGDAATVQQNAADIKASLIADAGLPVAVLRGPVFAAAIEQVLTATTREPDMDVLNGVRFETDSDAVTLTATDRYRISTRTLTPVATTTVPWAATVNADDLRHCLPELHRASRVELDATDRELWMRLPDRLDRRCRLIAEPFPDHRSMLVALPEVITRVTVPKNPLLRALEESSADQVLLHITSSAITVASDTGHVSSAHVPACVHGPETEVRFAITTLYPAVVTALGPDVLIDLRGHDQPATIRSADGGDLTTLAMPTRAVDEFDTTGERR